MFAETVTPRGMLTLALLEVRGVGTTAARRLLRSIHSAGVLPEVAISKPESLKPVLSAGKVDDFAEALVKAAIIRDALNGIGGKLIVEGDSAYPVRLSLLGDEAPLTLMVLGNTDLLNAVGIGFCGSRKASEKGIEACTDISEQLGEQSVNVVSGYAAGVDTAVHSAALESGGSTTVVLPMGIMHFRIKAELKHLWDWDKVLVVSQFPARLPWSGRNAMARNATICAFSDALVVVEAGSEGGTIEAGRTGLELGIPVFALHYEPNAHLAPGNRVLMGLGAHPLGRSRSSGRGNVGRVLELASRHQRGHPALLL